MKVASTSIRISTQTLEAVINASPVASLIVKADGSVVCANDAAAKLLQLSKPPTRLDEVFKQSAKLTEAVSRARRHNGPVPVKARSACHADALRLNIKALPGDSGRPTQYLMVTAMTRQFSNRQMLALKKKLETAAAEQRRLREANQKLREKVDVTLPRLKKLSTTDPLTGAFNRRYYDTRLKREWNRALRQGSSLALLYIDIDHFKAYNDSLGHPQGDICLQKVVKTLQSAVTREFDCVCRIGGEEFALLLPMTHESGALSVAKQVLSAVRSMGLPHPSAATEIVTVSVGAGSCSPKPGSDPARFVAEVDAALYRAKHQGRDRIVATRTSALPKRGPDGETNQPRSF